MRRRFESLPFGKMIAVSCVIFFVIVVIIEFIFALSKHNFQESLSYIVTPTFLLRKFIASLVYGLVIALIYKRKLKKKDLDKKH